MSKVIPTRRPLRLLHILYDQSKSMTTFTVRMKQIELANQLKISRQALNVHLRKLRDQGYIRTGRGFIDITEKGLGLLGLSANPTFVFVKVSPLKREEAYERMMGLPVQRVYRVAGDMDAVLVVEREKLDETLRELALLEGVQDTKSYVAIQTLK